MAEVAGVELTSPTKVLYPEQGITKLDLARYYERVAEHLLPHLAERPLTIVRCPQGRGRCFFQKHPRELPPAVGRRDIENRGGTREVMSVSDLQGVIALVQAGTLELHVEGTRIDRPEHPDRLVLDLDPGPGLDPERVVETARELARRLTAQGLESFVMTTGGKGLHVVAPLDRAATTGEVAAFARALAEGMEHERPDLWVAGSSKQRRRGRVFVDHLRNTRGATAICPFSTRARPGAPVATPLRWDELTARKLGPAHDLASVPRRLAALRSDPWGAASGLRQGLARHAQR